MLGIREDGESTTPAGAENMRVNLAELLREVLASNSLPAGTTRDAIETAAWLAGRENLVVAATVKPLCLYCGKPAATREAFVDGTPAANYKCEYHS